MRFIVEKPPDIPPPDTSQDANDDDTVHNEAPMSLKVPEIQTEVIGRIEINISHKCQDTLYFNKKQFNKKNMSIY